MEKSSAPTWTEASWAGTAEPGSALCSEWLLESFGTSAPGQPGKESGLCAVLAFPLTRNRHSPGLFNGECVGMRTLTWLPGNSSGVADALVRGWQAQWPPQLRIVGRCMLGVGVCVCVLHALYRQDRPGMGLFWARGAGVCCGCPMARTLL